MYLSSDGGQNLTIGFLDKIKFFLNVLYICVLWGMWLYPYD